MRSLLEKLDSGVKLYREEFACLMSAEPSVLNAVASDMAAPVPPGGSLSSCALALLPGRNVVSVGCRRRRAAVRVHES